MVFEKSIYKHRAISMSKFSQNFNVGLVDAVAHNNV